MALRRGRTHRQLPDDPTVIVAGSALNYALRRYIGAQAPFDQPQGEEGKTQA